MSNSSPYAIPVSSGQPDNVNSVQLDNVRLWNPETAGVCSFFLSPIFGSYIARKNWQALGETEEAALSRKWLVASVVMLLMALIGNVVTNGSGNFIGIVFLLTWYFASLKRQVKFIKSNQISYIRKPWLKVLSLALVSIYGSLFAILTVLGIAFNGNDYGTLVEFNGDELYYTSNCSEAEANALGEYLVSSEFFTGRGVSVQLNKESGTYEFRMVINKGLEHDPEVVEAAKQMASEISTTVFNGSEVDVHLCDDRLETIRVVVDF